jgi:hypothetical protein
LSARRRRSPLCHRLLGDARFHAVKLKYDEDLAAKARAAGCGDCGGRLDSAQYPRKPRGATSKLPDEYAWRYSFCCAVDGCRRRHTPPSIRFLGRRVYLGAVVVLATAMQQGVTPIRAQRLHEVLGVSLRTLARWREWWRAAFAKSDFWKASRARFSPPVEASGFPLALLERFGGDEDVRLLALLRLLAPISTPTGYISDQRF